MALSSNALCAKAKAMYGHRIKQEGYMDLCRKQTVGEVVTYLKAQTAYGETLSDMNVRSVHRHQVETALQKEYFRRCTRLMKYAPRAKQEFYLQEVMGIEVNLILDKILSLKVNSKNGFTLDLPEYLASKTSFNIYGLINVETFEELVEYFAHTKYHKILSKIEYNQGIDFNDIERQLTEFYYESYEESIKKHYKGKIQKQLLDVLYTSIELKNITKMYRLKKYFNVSSEEIRKMICQKRNRMPKSMMDSLIEAKDAKQFMQILSNSKYALYSDENDFVYIEYYVEKIRYNLAKRYMRFSNDAPLVYMTYCILQNIELDNLKHIIEGIRYNRDAASIEEMLIYV